MRVFCIAIYFYSPNRILLKSSLKQKEGNYKEQLSDDGQSLVKYYKLISCDFDFIEDNDLTLAETMDQMATDMKAAYRNLQAIQHSQNYSAGKIFSLIVICISQIYMLTGYFKGKSFGPSV